MQSDALLPRPPEGLLPGALLSILVHAGLLAALVFSVGWHLQSNEPVSAELWSSVPQVAAPKAEPAPAPKPTPAPEPKPAPPPPPPAPPPPKPVVREAPPPPAQDAQIAIERAARLKREEKEKADEAKRAAELQAKRDADLQARRDADAQKKRDAEAAQKRDAEAQKAETARLDKLRQDQLKRMQGALSGNGAPDSKGTAERDSAPVRVSADYAARLRATIKRNVVFNDTLPGNPVAVVEVSATTSGTIIARRLVKSSGVAAWDDAVLRAIDRTGTLPRDTDGRVPTSILIDFKLNE